MSRERWGPYYRERSSNLQVIRSMITHVELALAVLRRRPRRVIEVGCGLGSLSLLLSALNLETVALDSSPTVLKLARHTLGGKAHLVLGEAAHLPFKDGSFDVVFHQGLLEHYDAEAVARLLSEQERIGRHVVCSVPSDHYPRQDLGDENLLPPSQWTRLSKLQARYYRVDVSSLKNWMLRRCRPKPLHVILAS